MIVSEAQANIDMLIEKGEYDAALVQLNQTNESLLRSIQLKARVFELQGLFEKAESLLESSEDLHKNNWKFVQLQCKVYWKKKDVDGFKLAFKNLIKSKAPLQVQLKWQERLAVTEENYQLAIQTLQIVLVKNLSPNQKKAQQRLSSYYQRINDVDGFLRCVKGAQKKLLLFVPPFNKFTKVLLDSKSFDQSLNILEPLYKKYPKNKELFFGMCQVLFKSNPKRLYEFVKENLEDLDDSDFARLTSFPIMSDLLPALKTTTSGNNLSNQEILKTAILDIQKGDIQKGENLLRTLSKDEMPLKAEIILQALADIPAKTHFPRPLLKEVYAKQEVVVAKASQGIGTVIVFFRSSGCSSYAS